LTTHADSAQDPDNHLGRQRELISEIEEARIALEKGEATKGKSKFSFLRRKDAPKKKADWETYDAEASAQAAAESSKSEELADAKDRGNVIFDVEAIRAELASQAIEIKQLESTLPPMRLDLSKSQTLRAPVYDTAYDSMKSAPQVPPKENDSSRSARSTPGLPAAHNALQDEYDEWDTPRDHEPQMTFDTAYKEPPRYSPQPPRSYSLSPSPGRQGESSSAAAGNSDSWSGHRSIQSSGNSPGSRPKLESSKSTPLVGAAAGMGVGLGVGAVAGGATYEHNAWADDDEDEFGAEKEVQMSFE
jgi:hypothetical protein